MVSEKVPAVGAKTGKIFAQRISRNVDFEYINFGGYGHEFMFLYDRGNDGINRKWRFLDNHSTCTLLCNKNLLTNIREEDH